MNQHYRRYSYSDYLDSMQACGIVSLEMWCGAPHFMLDSIKYSDCKSYVQMARERNLQYVSLTSPSMMWQYQVAAPEKILFEKSIQYFSNGVHVAAELGCKIMSINSGWGYANEPFNSAFMRSVELVAQIADIAQKEGILLALESLQPTESNLVLRIEDAKKYLEILKHPSVKPDDRYRCCWRCRRNA